mgnify:CR=1 FL=1|tara:strand:+ start:1476 stop:1703 length:228 start_codon:yes stop_codon:yes gene_type:complete
MWTITKIDDRFIALKDDQQIPMKGERFLHTSPRGVLDDIARECADNDAPTSNCALHPNEHATAELIRSYGFTVAD